MHPNARSLQPHGRLKFRTIAMLVIIAIMAPFLMAACGDDEVAPPNTPEPTAMAPEPTEAAMMDEKMAMPALAIALRELNESGQTGWGTLTAKGGQTEVVLALNPGAVETELVHIHEGQCDTLGGVAHPLSSFADGAGSSVTVVDATLDSLLTGGFAINAHLKGDASSYTGCGNIPAKGGGITFSLGELDESGQTGWASLTAMGNQTEVILSLSSGSSESELVHIHTGQCGDTLGGVAHPLSSFTGGGGSSVTTVEATLDSLRSGGFAVNAHTKGNAGVYTACGNIPAGTSEGY